MSTSTAEPARTVTDEVVRSPCAGISLLIKSRERDIGGFSVRRYLPHAECRKVGPFVFFDQMGPAEFPPGSGLDVRPHPHIGLATLTYLFEGEILHRDSLGCVQAITPGAVNWMIAGRGIVHSERTGKQARAAGQRLHGLQVWVALPEADEETAPDFQHVRRQELPLIRGDGMSLCLVAGSAWGETSPVRMFSPLFYADASLGPTAVLNLTMNYTERAIYLAAGAARIRERTLVAGDMAVCTPGVEVEITALQDSRLILFGGAPIGDRILWWNLVSSSPARIEMAKQDWVNGRFGKIPGETEFIPLPE